MKCPSCGAEVEGKFCSSCGSPLQLVNCPSCGSGNRPGSRFCTNCGTQLPGAAGKGRGAGPPGGAGKRAQAQAAEGAARASQGPGGSGTLAWWVAGGLLVAVIIALGYPILTRDSNGAGGGAPPPGMGGGDAGLLDLTQMSEDSLATLLFNRVMMSNSTGDTADVEFFLPKAFTVYEDLNPTDPDGLYHYALLHLVGQDYESALAKASEGLAQVPNYLLLLAVSGEAAAALGDSAAARDFYSRYVEQYDAEMALLRPGYEHHQPIFPQYLAEARAYLDQG